MGCQAFLLLWRRWIRFVVVVVYIVLLVIAVPFCIWELERNGASDHVQAWFIGGMFVLMALPISFWGILQHIINYTTPHLQRYIIRILWMVPIYALNAWFALRYPSAAIYLDTLRECYEAYVIYNFMAYFLSFLNHEYPHLDIQIETKPPVNFFFPLCLLPPCQPSAKFIQHCKHGVLQYTVVRPTMTVIALICEMFDKYNEGDFNFTTAWSYIVIINNLSQIFAMYCLILFYKTFRDELQPLKPISKLLCVKAVVFLSFWQALLIAALVKTGVITEQNTFGVYHDAKTIATGLQDFVICIEMFAAAIAHYFSFSYIPFVNLAAEQQNCCASFLSMWNVRDVTEDVVEHARYIGRGMHRTLSRGKRLVRGGSSERTPLLAGSGGEEPNQQNSLAKTSDKAGNLDGDTVSSCGDSLYGHRYDTFVNKSTTSSMVNYADFRSETSIRQESRQALSASVSLRGFESSCDELERDGDRVPAREVDFTLVDVTAELTVDAQGRNAREGERNNYSNVHDDETFHHLDLNEDETSHNLDDNSLDGTAYCSDAENNDKDKNSAIHNEEMAHQSVVHGDAKSHDSIETGNDLNPIVDQTSQDARVHDNSSFYHLEFHDDTKPHFSDAQENEPNRNLNIYRDDLSHFSDAQENEPNRNLNIRRDDLSHFSDAQENEPNRNLNIHRDDVSHFSDAQENEPNRNLNIRRDDLSHFSDAQKDIEGSGETISDSANTSSFSDMKGDSSKATFSETTNSQSFSDMKGDSSKATFSETTNSQSFSDMKGDSSKATFSEHTNPKSLSDILLDSSEFLSAESSTPSKDSQDDHTERTEIGREAKQAGAIETSKSGSEHTTEAAEDTVEEDS